MKKVDLNFNLLDLDGNPVNGESNAGKFTAGLLMTEVKGDAIKYFDWAMDLNKLKPINIDESDLIKLKSLITDSEKITLLGKAQILKYLNSVK